MIPSPADDPRILRQSFETESYDVIEIALSDSGGIVAVLTFDRLADQTPTVTLAAGGVTTIHRL